nr:MAG TPA: hypothetical protein [Bacteriophage sp.]
MGSKPYLDNSFLKALFIVTIKLFLFVKIPDLGSSSSLPNTLLIFNPLVCFKGRSTIPVFLLAASTTYIYPFSILLIILTCPPEGLCEECVNTISPGYTSSKLTLFPNFAI